MNGIVSAPPPTFLSIEKIQDGGYLVRAAPYQPGYPVSMLFAATTIEEALKYIKKELA